MKEEKKDPATAATGRGQNCFGDPTSSRPGGMPYVDRSR